MENAADLLWESVPAEQLGLISDPEIPRISEVVQEEADTDTIGEIHDTEMPSSAIAESYHEDPAEYSVSHHPTPQTEAESDPAITAMQSNLSMISAEMLSLTAATAKVLGETQQIRRLIQEENAGRLQTMQEELDKYHEVEKGKVFDGILTDIARLYSSNVALLEQISDERMGKQLSLMFMDLLQILESYGISKLESKPGETRHPTHSQVIDREYTMLPDRHDTVVRSISPGFYIDDRTIVREMVFVFVYKAEEEPAVVEEPEVVE